MALPELVPETLEDSLRRALPGHYHRDSLSLFRQGGTRNLYMIEWGPGREKRIIKLDREPQSPRAARHVSRGYNTANELAALSRIRDPELHNLMRLLDFGELESGEVYTVEPYFESSSLQEAAPLSQRDFATVFSQVLEAEQYLVNELGVLHRDPNPSNILINDKKVARLADLANIGRITDVTAKALPTAGKHYLTDPLIIGEFNESEREYSVQSEIYALGTAMYFALVGKYIVDIDPDNHTAKGFKYGEVLTGFDGKIDKITLYQVTMNALTQLPRGSTRYWDLLRKALSSFEKERYKTIDEFVADFKKASRPTMLEQLKKHWMQFTATGLVLAATAAGGLYLNNRQHEKALDAAREQAETYTVRSEVDGSTQEVTNNLFTMDVSVDYNKMSRTNSLYTPYIRKMPGGKLEISVNTTEVPRPTTSPNGLHDWFGYLRGKIYIEGYAGQNFTTLPASVNKAVEHGEGEYYGDNYKTIRLPADMKPGVYNLAIEVYAPDTTVDPHAGNQAKLSISAPGVVLAKERIPIVVGNVPLNDRLDFTYVRLGLSPNASACVLGDQYRITIDRSTHYRAELMGTDWKHDFQDSANSNCASGYMWLPTMNDSLPRTLHLVASKGAEVLSEAFVPIMYRHYSPTYGQWELVVPDSNFYKTMQQQSSRK